MTPTSSNLLGVFESAAMDFGYEAEHLSGASERAEAEKKYDEARAVFAEHIEALERRSIEQLAELISDAKKQDGFAGFQPSIEEQVLNMAKDGSKKLHWRKDVSGGCGQAFLACWIQPKGA